MNRKLAATVIALFTASALLGGTAAVLNIESTTAQSDWETCAYYDGWGDPDCEQAAKEGRPNIVKQYEDGSYITDTGYEGCLPEAYCDDTV